MKLSIIGLMLIVGCASSSLSARRTENKPVRIASMGSGITPGDCPEALRRAREKPDLEVDRLPTPTSMKPAPLQKVPRTALRKDGSAEVKVDVIVDTLGHADMTTFRVVSASHPWLANNVRSVIPRWRFSPAELAGCKVPRVYHFMASTQPRKRAK